MHGLNSTLLNSDFHSVSGKKIHFYITTRDLMNICSKLIQKLNHVFVVRLIASSFVVDLEANFSKRPSMASPALKGLVKGLFCEDLTTTKGHEFQVYLEVSLRNYKEFYNNFCNSICRKEIKNSFFHRRELVF